MFLTSRFFIALPLLYCSLFSTTWATWTAIGDFDWRQYQRSLDLAVNSAGDVYLASGSRVTMYQNSQWIDVGELNADDIREIKLAIAADDTVYVSYYASNDKKIMIKQFDGEQWLSVGSPIIHDQNYLANKSLAIASDGTPYIGYTRFIDFHQYEFIVRKYNGSAWIGVEGLYQPGIVLEPYPITGFAIAPDDTLYFYYADYLAGFAVKKWLDGEWVIVGEPFGHFSNHQVTSPRLVFSQDNSIYVIYRIDFTSSIAIVQFKNDQWNFVGTQQSSNNTELPPDLVLDKQNKPYIAISDNAPQAQVMEFNQDQWQTLEDTPVAAGALKNVKLAFTDDNSLYLAYSYENEWGSYNVAVLREQSSTTHQPCADTIASYSIPKRRLTIPVIKIPVIDFLSGETTGEIETWSGVLKQVYGTAHFRLIQKTFTQVSVEETDLDCAARYNIATGTLMLPAVQVPTGVVIGNQDFEQDMDIFEVSLKWVPLNKSFMIEQLEKLD